MDLQVKEGGVVWASSHNNEDLPVRNPLQLALDHRLVAIEADVYLVGSEILVGHEPSSLDPTKTLKSEYLDPLFELIRQRNGGLDVREWRGVYDGADDQTLYLFLDLKGNGGLFWPHLHTLLQPFLEASYLSTSNLPTSAPSAPPSITYRPLTIIGTGSTPLQMVFDMSPRFIFYDGPLLSLSQAIPSAPLSNYTPDGPSSVEKQGSSCLGLDPGLEPPEWTAAISPTVSAPWPVFLYALPPPLQSQYWKSYTAEARRRGMKSRVWGLWEGGLPTAGDLEGDGEGVRGWGGTMPVRAVRRAGWGVLRAGGVDFLNTDWVKDAAEWERQKSR